ncbi:TPA: NAD(P)-dependent malic enzyme [Bacillus thuringiensis]|jgi:malate dehydrogenase (oxaloacetate-decarboxylating)|uniref:NAD-dependent malic enzyme n=5 Tax=Bacillus cereus group TaxID=86661 RepID=A0A9X5N9L6_BACTU|nr:MULTISPECIES: malic enzyme-like NAD(P)-binding protein [Bacillus]ANN30789.1 malate dehydrogenase [Bacillus thuringiensis serovar coreanensis]NIE93822.1 NAD-dependent malic enzyme [Bacillus sp. Ab-1751]OUB23648.1 NAD-dependent malic enzyme [Bacillus thuringiensis serovar yunnanensis]QQP80153.1 NAD-dependent malic enzyme [Bacillus sp. TK-2]CGG54302.1 malate dehydrogenase (decarboxylating) [Streptococcus pneumoniae]BCA34992.1 malate dehydrogenase [Bacillus wiedmannii]
MLANQINERSLLLHKELVGKIEITSKVEVNSADDLSLTYTPGVAESCKAIAADEETVYDYTARGNMVAVVSDGTAVLGLGNIGPKAAMPVMEGKSILFKKFANVDAFPLCLGTTDVDEIVTLVKNLEPTFAGINLEDIAAPRCFEIEKRLKEETNIPVFHDDQHGTAIVVLAAVINALKVVSKQMDNVKIVINGAGSAGIAIGKLLLKAGAKHITLVSLEGIVCEGETWMNEAQIEVSKKTNREHVRGTLKEAINQADIFIGVSAPNVLTKELVQTMNEKAIVFAMANPIPEIFPEDALEAGAAVVGTGRSDYANQVNNVLAFPGIFRGALDVRATDITEEMKLAAAYGIANIITDEERNANYVIPNPLDKRVVPSVAEAVAKAAIDSGVAQITKIPRY